jgi:hypothetical protein
MYVGRHAARMEIEDCVEGSHRPSKSLTYYTYLLERAYVCARLADLVIVYHVMTVLNDLLLIYLLSIPETTSCPSRQSQPRPRGSRR